jgi:hypothetical protein
MARYCLRIIYIIVVDTVLSLFESRLRQIRGKIKATERNDVCGGDEHEAIALSLFSTCDSACLDNDTTDHNLRESNCPCTITNLFSKSVLSSPSVAPVCPSRHFSCGLACRAI